MKTHAKNHQAGFTLLEFIVALVIAAIMAAMVYTFFGTALTQSSVPIARLQKASKLHQVMENIVADFNRLNKINLRYTWRASPIVYKLGDITVPTGSGAILGNGYYYECTTAGSNSLQPAWPTVLGESTTSGGALWKASGNVWIAAPTIPYVPGTTIVVPYYNNGHFYKCTGATAQCAMDVISWNTSPGGTTSPGNYWTEVGTILERSDGDTDNLMYYLMTSPNRYGLGTVYTVDTTQTKFIKFSGTNEADATGTDEKNILKVTIKGNDPKSNETLMELFTIR